MASLFYHGEYQFARLAKSIAPKLISIDKQTIFDHPKLDIEFGTFCGEKSLPELKICVAACLKNWGVPAKWVLYSDGSLTRESLPTWIAELGFFEIADPSATLASTVPSHNALVRLSESCVMGKKMPAMLDFSARPSAQKLYLDSDVFIHNHCPPALADAYFSRGAYMPDCAYALVDSLIPVEFRSKKPVNAGFLTFGRFFDWQVSLAALDHWIASGCADRHADWYFVEQTLCHLAMHANGAMEIPPEVGVLRVDDQFSAGGRLAHTCWARHYVGPVRHKLWLQAPGLLIGRRAAQAKTR